LHITCNIPINGVMLIGTINKYNFKSSRLSFLNNYGVNSHFSP
jgi:hypothetical protein